jgi:hypothetical protein
LVNADNAQAIQTLTDGGIINLATAPSQHLNIRADTSPATVGSVILVLSGTQSRTQTENGAPYTLFGDNGTVYNSWTPAVGPYTLKSTPYSRSNGSGTVGTPMTINFSVINQTPTPTPTPTPSPTPTPGGTPPATIL